jgi:uncharacterized cupin superfamily protein
VTDELAPATAVSAASLTIPLEPTTAHPDAPCAGFLPLATMGGCEVGVWEHSVGTSTDVEEDEVFVVLSGSATICLEDHTELVVRAGDLVRLAAGMRTTWTVHHTLRKVYVSLDANPATAGA